MDANGGTLSLQTIASTYTKLEVDDYQRPYTWEQEQIDELFDDLHSSFESPGIHFFGTLILQQGEKDGEVKVVDGQQRLTTCFILMAALRDELLELSNHVIQGAPGEIPIFVPQRIFEFLIVGVDRNHFRLSPNRSIRPLMENCVFKQRSDGQTQIPVRDRAQGAVTLKFRKAVAHIRKRLSDDLDRFTSEQDRLIRINEYVTTIQTKFHVLRVLTNDDSESLDIFLTLNNRGVPLGPSDLVRGEVLKRKTRGVTVPRELERINRESLDEWNAVSEVVKEPEVFLRHFLVSIHNGKVQKKKVVDTVLKRIKWGASNADQERANADLFWRELVNAADVYGRIVSPSVSTGLTSKSANLYLPLLNKLSKTHRILLLNVMKFDLDPSALEEILRLLFVYGFVYSMNGQNAQDLENEYQAWGQEFASDGDIDLLCRHLTEGIEDNPVDTKKYFSGEADGDYVTRALLYATNYLLSARTWELDDYHLEHIAPQKSTPAWVDMVFGEVDNPADDYEDVISQLGNLTLLDPECNWKIRNWSLERKQSEYRRCTSQVTLDLADIQRWNLTDIEDRSKWLIENFDLIWNVDIAGQRSLDRFTDWQRQYGADN